MALDTERLSGLLRLGAGAFGVLYVVGLLIVNIDLGRHGLLNLGLTRSEYVMSGALWALLMLPTCVALQVADSSAKHLIALRRYLLGVLIYLLVVVMFLLMFSFVLLFLSYGEMVKGQTVIRDALLVVGTILFQAEAIRMAIVYLGRTLREDSLSLASFFLPTTPRFFAMNLAAALAMFVFYSAFVFPHFSREFGGGKKSLIEVLLSNPLEVQWSALGISVSENGKKVGPISLLLETDSMYVVAALEKPNVTEWLPARTTAPAVGIHKGAAEPVNENETVGCRV
jgi:hypothetical protein